jgi:hypothetical protein
MRNGVAKPPGADRGGDLGDSVPARGLLPRGGRGKGNPFGSGGRLSAVGPACGPWSLQIRERLSPAFGGLFFEQFKASK